jgi:prefoldin subunit 5
MKQNLVQEIRDLKADYERLLGGVKDLTERNAQLRASLSDCQRMLEAISLCDSCEDTRKSLKAVLVACRIIADRVKKDLA